MSLANGTVAMAPRRQRVISYFFQVLSYLYTG